MPIEITIPRLGWTMEEGTFVGWLKSEGERVAAGEPLFILEGDKATQEIESLESGLLRIPRTGPKVGDRVAVGTVIGYLVAAGEDTPVERKTADAGMPAQGAGTGTRTPRASPRARRIARELAVDISTITGTGNAGRIVERDIRAAAAKQAPKLPAAEYESVKVSPVRRAIAERMSLSASTTAAVTITTTVDASNLVNLRRQFKAAAGTREKAIGYIDIVVKLTALALEKHPLLNARWNGEEILVWKSIHIGVAVDTDLGLFVPVIRDVSRLSLREVANRSRDLVDRARAGTLTGAEIAGSTFTITNLGALGVEAFTPLINPPECAILGLGRIHNQVVVEHNQFVARDRMTLSLTFDHRIVDGAPAARFLQSLTALLEIPSAWLIP